MQACLQGSMRPAKQGAQELLPCRILGIIIDISQLARGWQKVVRKNRGCRCAAGKGFCRASFGGWGLRPFHLRFFEAGGGGARG